MIQWVILPPKWYWLDHGSGILLICTPRLFCRLDCLDPTVLRNESMQSTGGVKGHKDCLLHQLAQAFHSLEYRFWVASLQDKRILVADSESPVVQQRSRIWPIPSGRVCPGGDVSFPFRKEERSGEDGKAVDVDSLPVSPTAVETMADLANKGLGSKLLLCPCWSCWGSLATRLLVGISSSSTCSSSRGRHLLLLLLDLGDERHTAEDDGWSVRQRGQLMVDKAVSPPAGRCLGIESIPGCCWSTWMLHRPPCLKSLEYVVLWSKTLSPALRPTSLVLEPRGWDLVPPLACSHMPLQVALSICNRMWLGLDFWELKNASRAR